MKSISTKLCLLFMLVMASVTNAQEFQGKAIYESKTTIDVANFGRGRQLTEEQKKMISERMKQMFEKTFILVFNKTESVYKEEEKLETPGAGGGPWRGMMGNFTAGAQYKNVKDAQLLQEQEFFGKQFLIKDDLPKLEWKMENETKQIGQYTCFKATAIKKVDEMDFSSMRPRPPRDRNESQEKEKAKDSTSKNVMDEVEVPKEIVITAWYTPQIPVNQGPGEYWGLPGLILEVNADRTTILCSKIVLNPDEKETIKVPTKGKEVTREEYNDIMKKKIEEMREMYGGRRGGGRRF
ncbi:GLPGLI family protein [Mangrovimonas sp. TPBH4]|uniref:GLPGLI family protein n=1 Tax=Mangrovimonas sp. TPBH4 TaxID=1645914 RepID=UPI0006B5C037|nr:GLPGLI family protein [Mangrovimonas sp. TPBH4]